MSSDRQPGEPGQLGDFERSRLGRAAPWPGDQSARPVRTPGDTQLAAIRPLVQHLRLLVGFTLYSEDHNAQAKCCE